MKTKLNHWDQFTMILSCYESRARTGAKKEQLGEKQ
jgi:hypothetical protein